MGAIDKLNSMRTYGGAALTSGLSDEVILEFAQTDATLLRAIDGAIAVFKQLGKDDPDLLQLDEASQIQKIQEGYVNFYADDAINPFVVAAASGPWIVTLKGAVVHDNGGYGMLGFGHAPEAVLTAMAQPHAMANVMTPNISQKYFIDALRREVGHSRGGSPFSKFLCLNSGSEAVTVAARIADINAKLMTDPGGPKACRTIRKLGLAGAFHGRTDRPAQFSDSTRETYTKYLATFRDNDSLITVDPNDIEQLEQVYQWADDSEIFIEAFFMEPVMGEGNPGQAISPEFYAKARELTLAHGSLFLVDSIQAGIRAHGVLSIVDYPGFEHLPPPDMETYSKALNAGQYPFSVLAMTATTANLYQKGIYGNTMTTNPRALDVACSVLNSITPELRANIRVRGQEFLDKLASLQSEMGGRITKIQGTGLLFSVELDGACYKGYGANSSEEYMRQQGVNVIHGGENSLRYTPHFMITSAEIDLIIDATRDAIVNGPRKTENTAASAVA